jgi:polyphenol oxidase
MKHKSKEEAMIYSFLGCEAFCVFSTKADGNMKGEEGKNNRDVYFEKYIPKTARKIVLAEQIHSNSVEVVGRNSPDFIRGADGLITAERGISLGTFGADCRNILLCDEVAEIIGNTHLGYRGILQKCAHNTISKMINLGAKKEDIKAIIGPGACGKCYEFDEKDAAIFSRLYGSFISSGENDCGKVLIDLLGIIFRQLTGEIGILPENIQCSNICTIENEKFFSQRRQKKDPVEAGVAVIGMY